MELKWMSGSSLAAIYAVFSLFCQTGEAAIDIQLVPPPPTCGGSVKLRCVNDSVLTLGNQPSWNKNALPITVITPKYREYVELSQSYASLEIYNFTKDDDGSYTCSIGLDPSISAVQVNCTASTPEPTPPVCILEIRCRTLVIICGIFAGITVVMWVICCLLEYKKKECCQKWCCIRLIVLGFFAVIAWIFWGISYWQCVVRCQGSQKAVFIGPIVIGFCTGVAGIIWGIFCCLQHTGIIHCIPPKEKPDFKKYTEQELKWMDEMIAATKKVDAATRLNESKKKEKDVQKRLKTCKERCAAEQNKLSKVMNSYEMKIQDCIQRLQDKMNELEAEMPKLEGNTGV